MIIKLTFDNGVTATYSNVDHFEMDGQDNDYQDRIQPPKFLRTKIEERRNIPVVDNE